MAKVNFLPFLLCSTCLFAVAAAPVSAKISDPISPALQHTAPPMADNSFQSADKVRVQNDYGKLPLYFIENQGQIDSEVIFYERGSGHSFFFTKKEVLFTFRSPTSKEVEKPELESKRRASAPERKFGEKEPGAVPSPAVVRLTPLGISSDVEIIPGDPQPGKVNYFIGNDPKKWRTNVPTFGSVTYREAYPGVDIKFYGNDRQLEYDIIVKPGADPSQAKFLYSGMEALEISQNGDLSIQIKGGGKLLQRKPFVYQQIEGQRVKREASFKIENEDEGASSFASGHSEPAKYICRVEVAGYDPQYALIIDPVLVYSTYLGGSSGDLATGIAVDIAGNAYVTGYTGSSDFPTKNSLYPNLWGGYDVFVTKINASGSALVYSTYLGGSNWDSVPDIAVDTAGNAYVTGSTDSSDFPTKNPLYPNFGGERDVFVTKINASGSALVYSTYLGGNWYEEGYDIAVDGVGNAYVTGYTQSSDFPTKNPLYPNFRGERDVFVTKINASGSALVYSTYLGGNWYEEGYDIAVDSAGNVYVVGCTFSPDFPTKNPLYPNLWGHSDAFVTKINASGSALVYSTYLGGSSGDLATGIAVDSAGNAYVTGGTDSPNFPTKNSLYPNLWGDSDAFVTKINASGSALVYSTYLGGSNWDCNYDLSYDIALDIAGNAYVTGYTCSFDFPTKNPLYPNFGGERDVFVTKINASGSALVYSTYLGGSSFEIGLGIAVDGVGNAYVTGRTDSPDFPTKSPLYPDLWGSEDGFVIKICSDCGAVPHFSFGHIADQQINQPFPVTITAYDAYGNTDTSFNGEVSLSTTIGFVKPMTAYLTNGTITLPAVTLDSGGIGVRMRASGSGRYGESNSFNVTGGGNSAFLSGYVKQYDSTTVADATVLLKLGQSEIASTISNAGGYYSFSNLAPGEYTVSADAGDGRTSGEYRARVANGRSFTLNLFLEGSDCNPTGLTPVLLVPGILGSSTGHGGPWPTLPRFAPDWDDSAWNTDSWGLHDPLRDILHVGWRELVHALEALDENYQVGCTVFPVPYDWRMDIDQAAKKYLEPWIAKAKAKAGVSRVNVIAHSMGGLVTRAYIQGDSCKNDIDKFAMVGTPNHGAATPYYLWQGGDPITADLVNISGAYAMSMWLQHLTFYLLPPPGTTGSLIYQLAMHHLTQSHIKSVEQLLGTFKFLNGTRALECEPNEWLINLNKDPRMNEMGGENDTGKVWTKIFAGTGKQTIEHIKVGPKTCWSPGFYQDGIPYWLKKTSDGDGTVLTTSASLGSLEISQETGSHSSLIDVYRQELLQFIDDRSAPAVALKAMLAESPAKQLTISISGRAQPYLIDPQGRKIGIDPSTYEQENDFPDGVVNMGSESGSLVINDPVNGQYTLQLKDGHAEDFQLIFFYQDESRTLHQTFSCYTPGSIIAFGFNLDSTSASPLQVNRSPVAPTGLKADPYTSGGLKTKLCWNTSSYAGVTAYKIYSKGEDEPTLSPVATVAGPCYSTADPWAADSSIRTRIYAVSALKADGSESFLSNMVQNNDRDHDGLSDAEEIPFGSNMASSDTDGDGLNDGEEYLHGTSPLQNDTDADGLLDSIEVSGCTLPADDDTDDDGITDGVEDANHNGVVDLGETNPCNPDSDGDGIQDGTERGYTLINISPDTDVAVFQPDLDPLTRTDPFDPDSDNDGLADGQEDANRNGRIDPGETDPCPGCGQSVVTIVAIDPNASENGDWGKFKISRTGDVNSPLVVSIALKGTAVNGGDYVLMPGTVTIPAGKRAKKVKVRPIDDSIVGEYPEKVKMKIKASANYQVGVPNKAVVTITDND